MKPGYLKKKICVFDIETGSLPEDDVLRIAGEFNEDKVKTGQPRDRESAGEDSQGKGGPSQEPRRESPAKCGVWSRPRDRNQERGPRRLSCGARRRKSSPTFGQELRKIIRSIKGSGSVSIQRRSTFRSCSVDRSWSGRKSPPNVFLFQGTGTEAFGKTCMTFTRPETFERRSALIGSVELADYRAKTDREKVSETCSRKTEKRRSNTVSMISALPTN
jgi:hypothetical protein